MYTISSMAAGLKSVTTRKRPIKCMKWARGDRSDPGRSCLDIISRLLLLLTSLVLPSCHTSVLFRYNNIKTISIKMASKNKGNVLIIGASRGLGNALAEDYAKQVHNISPFPQMPRHPIDFSGQISPLRLSEILALPVLAASHFPFVYIH